MKKIWLILIIVACCLMSVGLLEIYISYNWLKVTEYEVMSEKIDYDTKVCLLADLHDHEYGKNNCDLVMKVAEENPDLIIMCGDFLNKYSEDASVPLALIPQLTEIAPVYYSFGNQEMDYMKSHEDLPMLLAEAGANILEEEWADIEVNGNKICLAGMYDYAFAVDGYGHMDKTKMAAERLAFLESFQSKKSFKIMSVHRPDSFIFGQATDTWNVDLVLSGHLHGGQVIIPFVGGLYAGDQGLFPEYDFGEYHFEAVKNMIITTGLGSDKEKLPRFNNIPEIVVVQLRPDL